MSASQKSTQVRSPKVRKTSAKSSAVTTDKLAAALAASESFWWHGTASPLRLTEAQPATAPLLKKALPPGRPIASWAEWISPNDATRVAEFFAAALKNQNSSIDYRIAPDAQTTIWVRHTIVAAWKQGSQVFFEGSVRDISQKKHLERECLAISEREQNRIGQDLHDDLCQVLAGLSCLTRVLETRIAPKLPEEVPNLREINQQMVEAMDRTRALTHGLYTARMRSGDVRAALIELGRQVHIRFGVEVTTRFTGRFPEHPTQDVVQVYRIAQEAISNAIKHGNATTIALSLKSAKDGMHLTVRDNGSGLAPAKPHSDGIGTHIMRHRASLLSGSLDIRPAPTRGVLLSLTYHPSKARI